MFIKPDPNKVVGMGINTYDKINDEGYAPEETVIAKGDITLAKVSPIQPVGNSDKSFKDNSDVYKYNTPGTVDRVYSDLFNHEGYGMRKMRLRSERIPQIGDKMACFDPNTEIMTDHGWMYFKDLDIETHKVAILVNGTNIKYEHPHEKQVYDYEGDMYVIKSNQVDLMVTPNHRMYVSCKGRTDYKLIQAQDIYGKMKVYKKSADGYIDIPASDFIKDNKFILPGCVRKESRDIDPTKWVKYDDKELDLESFLTFFGIWMAEGCTKKNHGVYFATHKQRVKDELQKVCDKLDIDITKRKDKDESDGIYNRWIITDKQYLEYCLLFLLLWLEYILL